MVDVDTLKVTKSTDIHPKVEYYTIKKLIFATTGLRTLPRLSNFHSVQEVDIQDNSITAIPDYFLNHSSTIRTVKLPSSVYNIGVGAFYHSSISNIQFSNIKLIDISAFYHCYNLVNIDLSNVQTLNRLCFAECKNLKKITFKKNNKFHSIGSKAFYGTKITELIDVYIEDMHDIFYNTPIRKIQLPESQTSFFRLIYPLSELNHIKVQSQCSLIIQHQPNLETVDYPNVDMMDFRTSYLSTDLCSLSNNPKLKNFNTKLFTKIPHFFFYRCESIESVDLGNVQYIGYGAFAYCTSLKSLLNFDNHPISFHNDDNDNRIGAFYRCFNISIPKISNSMNKYNYDNTSAFAHCGITDVIIDSQENASPIFADCHLLKRVTYLNSCKCTYLPEYTFYNCHNLEEVIQSPAIRELRSYVFVNTKISSINLEKISQISSFCFINSGLKSLVLNSSWMTDQITSNLSVCFDDPTIETIDIGSAPFIPHIFKSLKSNVKIITSYNQKDNSFVYEKDNLIYLLAVMNYEQESYEIPNDIHHVLPSAFNLSPNIKKVVIKTEKSFDLRDNIYIKHVISLTLPKLSGCVNLNTLECQKVQSIDDNAFSDCYELSKLPDLDEVATIGSNAFKNCKKISNLRLPKLTTINEFSFANTSSNAIDFSSVESLTSISKYAFFMSDIESFKCPNSLVSIGEFAFAECRNLIKFELNQNISVVDVAWFVNTNIKTIEIPNTVTKIVNALSNKTYVSANRLLPFKLIFKNTASKYFYNGADLFEQGNPKIVYRITPYFEEFNVRVNNTGYFYDDKVYL